MVERMPDLGLHLRHGSAGALSPLVFFALALVAIMFLSPAPAAQADSISVYSYQVEEEYTIEVNEVGDAKCTDVLTYDPGFFNKQGFNFEHYPFLISRRYCQPCDIREIENFQSSVDNAKASITITFDQPGKAYNQGTAWEMYGLYSEPKFEVEGKQVFEEESTVNSEFTLWQNLEFKTTTFVKLPDGAENVHWDSDKNALVWVLPYSPPDLSNATVFGRNQAVFFPVAAVLILAGLAGTTIVFLQRRRPAMATAAAPVAGPGEAPAESSPARFCRHCGENLRGDDSHFCPMCGKRRDNSLE
jgi:hypothetical protein